MSEGNVEKVRRLYDAWGRGDTFRDGKVVRYEWFHDETDAFEALGSQG